MECVRTLVQEHDNILRMLDVIHKASLDILGGAPIETADFKKMVEFIRLYADKTHHGKEEEYLFMAITEELGAIGDNLVRHGMLVEHDIGRLYVSDLDAALDACAEQPGDETRLAVLVSAGSYERLLRRHIQKENDVLFPFGEKNLSAERFRQVKEQMQAFELDERNASVRAEQLAILDELERKYHA